MRRWRSVLGRFSFGGVVQTRITICAMREDCASERAKAAAGTWVRTSGMSDRALAEKIRADGIDVLVDLTLHMASNRLGVFARRPAPVQVTYLAYPGTSGLSAMNYRL